MTAETTTPDWQDDPDHDGLTGQPTGNRPADPPSSPAEPPAAPGPHPGTPEGQGPILGRVRIPPDGELWQDRGDGLWQGVGVERALSLEDVEETWGETREAVLVTPAGARIIEAAVEMAAALMRSTGGVGPLAQVSKDLVAAVDAMQAGQPAEIEPTTGAPYDSGLPEGCLCHIREDVDYGDVRTPPEGGCPVHRPPASLEEAVAAGLPPEPGNGPGWNRSWLLDCMLPHLPSASYNEPDLHDEAERQLRALLADRDRLASRVEGLESIYSADEDELIRQRTIADQLRARVSDLTAERDRALRTAQDLSGWLEQERRDHGETRVRVSSLEEELVTARSELDRWVGRFESAIATAHRDGAATALDDLAADYERHGALSEAARDSAVPLRGLPSALRKRAAEIRAGTREFPAPASGEER